MVKQLKVGDRVRARAIDALGKKDAKREFPDDWETLFIFGKCVERVSRSMWVKWDRVMQRERTKVSTRFLQREEPVETAAAAAAAPANDDGNNMIDVTNEDGSTERSVAIESTDDSEDSENATIEAVLHDSEEAVSSSDDETSDEDDDDLRSLLKPHGL